MKNRTRQLAAVMLCVALNFLPGAATAQFQSALPGYRYQFPRDFYNHAGYQTEWWYYTGNLQTADGKAFGFELTFFRKGVDRDSRNDSAWSIQDIYLAHFAISDLSKKKFYHSERINRAGPGIAGASEPLRKVWNGNWSMQRTDSGEERLVATAKGIALELTLRSQKPPVIHGENGVSQKSSGPGKASHYFSETRLRAAGAITLEGQHFETTGLAWMDHEFFTHQLDSNQSGWDWISLQLSDNTELMLFHIRRKDGSIDPFSAGTYVDETGRSKHLKLTDFQLTAGAQPWKSSQTGANYPVQWQIAIPTLGIRLELTTPLPSQELNSSSRLVPSYWEGAVTVHGARGEVELRGVGYLEMTGYAAAESAPRL